MPVQTDENHGIVRARPRSGTRAPLGNASTRLNRSQTRPAGHKDEESITTPARVNTAGVLSTPSLLAPSIESNDGALVHTATPHISRSDSSVQEKIMKEREHELSKGLLEIHKLGEAADKREPAKALKDAIDKLLSAHFQSYDYNSMQGELRHLFTKVLCYRAFAMHYIDSCSAAREFSRMYQEGIGHSESLFFELWSRVDSENSRSILQKGVEHKALPESRLKRAVRNGASASRSSSSSSASSAVSSASSATPSSSVPVASVSAATASTSLASSSSSGAALSSSSTGSTVPPAAIPQSSSLSSVASTPSPSDAPTVPLPSSGSGTTLAARTPTRSPSSSSSSAAAALASRAAARRHASHDATAAPSSRTPTGRVRETPRSLGSLFSRMPATSRRPQRHQRGDGTPARGLSPAPVTAKRSARNGVSPAPRTQRTSRTASDERSEEASTAPQLDVVESVVPVIKTRDARPSPIRTPVPAREAPAPVQPPSQQAQRRGSSHDDGWPHRVLVVNDVRYAAMGVIGKGGSSKVYRAMKMSEDSRAIVAIKKVNLRGVDQRALEGFTNEIDLLERLKGKAEIVQLLDYEHKENVLYLVLEFGEIDFSKLLNRLQQSKMNCANYIRLYWQQMLLAVNAIHEERIVHGDLKPANFVCFKGTLRLIDFGIAKAIENDTTRITRDSQVGTANYISPEALINTSNDRHRLRMKLGRSSDVWSLGCILYQMVYGQSPFAHYCSLPEKIQALLNPRHKIEYADVAQNDQPVNNMVVEVMQGCLRWKPEDRFTIEQLLNHPFLQW